MNDYPEVLTGINVLSATLRPVVAEVVSSRLGTTITPRSLPRVEFVVNHETQKSLKMWNDKAVPGVPTGYRSTIGDTLTSVQYHPEAVLLWANNRLEEHSENPEIQDQIERFDFSDEDVADRYLEMAGTQLTIVGMLTQLPELDPGDIERDVLRIVRLRR